MEVTFNLGHLEFTESFKDFEIKSLWYFWYIPRDKNFRRFAYE